MELRMNEYQLPEKISFNFEEIKAEVEAKSKEYASVVYTEDQIKQAKSDRATLNKFVKAIEDKRKEIKSTYLVPYMAFEAQCKEITGTINTAVKAIDEQVKGFEEQQKREKQDAIIALWKSKEKPEWLALINIEDEKWLNASVKMSAIEKDVDTKLEQIAKDIEMLSNLPEFGFEAVEVYKSTLDVNKAVFEAQRMSQIAKAKAEAEEKRKAEEQARKEAEFAKQMNPPVDEDNLPGQVTFTNPEEFDRIAAEAQPTPEKQWVAFQAFMSTDDALALKEFFNSRGIEFRRG